MSNYVIIDADKLRLRIEELNRELIRMIDKNYSETSRLQIQFTLNAYKEILSQSKPLIPEIENAFDEGFNSEEEVYKGNPTGKIIGKKEYLSNLKLDI